MKNGTVRVRLADLVEDFSVYPRHAVDSSWISELARSIEAGDELPPPVIERSTKRIVDGLHRARAHRKVLGRGGEIDVIERDYASDVALLQDAIESNATHARKLDQQDRTRCALLLEERGVSVQQISVVLHTTEARVRELVARVVIVKPKGQTGAGDRRPAKPVTYPARGGAPRDLDEEQYRVMQGSSGHRTAQTVTQLTRELESSLIELGDPELRGKFWTLHDVIAASVPRP